MNNHPSHINEVNNLNKAIGQLEGIKKMISEKRYCIEILTQFKAVRSAIKSVEINILQKHLSSCLKDCLIHQDTKEIEVKLEEIKSLLKKFME